jgi:hypothetical protein
VRKKTTRRLKSRQIKKIIKYAPINLIPVNPDCTPEVYFDISLEEERPARYQMTGVSFSPKKIMKLITNTNSGDDVPERLTMNAELELIQMS